MSFRFCPNLSFLFSDSAFASRYQLAKSLGFKGVESGFPFNEDLNNLVKEKNNAGIEQVLVNIYTGDTSKGELGCACIPKMSQAFDDALDKTIDLAKALDCKMIHLMSGKVVGLPTEENHDTYLFNIKRATKKLEENSIIGLIEPINPITVPGYYMNSYERALSVIQIVNSPNLKLMLDIFHLQQICGNISHNIKTLLPYIGHIQIAQVPHRNEPSTPGEINFEYVFKLLESYNYSKWIGLEYVYKNGFGWISDYGYSK